MQYYWNLFILEVLSHLCTKAYSLQHQLKLVQPCLQETLTSMLPLTLVPVGPSRSLVQTLRLLVCITLDLACYDQSRVAVGCSANWGFLLYGEHGSLCRSVVFVWSNNFSQRKQLQRYNIVSNLASNKSRFTDYESDQKLMSFQFAQMLCTAVSLLCCPILSLWIKSL